MRTLCIAIMLTAIAVATVIGQEQEKPSGTKTFEEATKDMAKMSGFFSLYWDAGKGKLLLEVDKWNQEFLYLTWLATGIGSNDLGFDRGQLGETRVVAFQRHGPKVLLVQSNYAFRAGSIDPAEKLAVREAFAESVLGGFGIEAEGKAGQVLIDVSKFFVADGRDIAGGLRRSKQGSYTLDVSRSALDWAHTKNFPKNTEVETILTFVGEPTGALLRDVVPNPSSITVHQRHSFIQLPDPGYKPRRFDPRAGYFPLTYVDFAVPLSEPLEQRFITRHRLKKKDPSAKLSEPVQPLVYYVDRGTPEPIRAALIEGAGWWNQAFEAAGYKNGFQVKLMPERADPLDVRYNVIQWVHRSTRGWAYGNAVVDPRTGEILKGHVTMDSQRARQVYRIAEGLLASYEEGKPVDHAIEGMVLARMRQLSAHEVGHTLGLAHNFSASTTGRASVMDYPHPLVKLKEGGSFDVSEAYAVGIGAWDKAAICYGYSEFPDGTQEDKDLHRILDEAHAKGLFFLTDEDARPSQGAAAHPLAHLWDNGANAIDELERLLAVRKRALERLSEKNVRLGSPYSSLEEQLVVMYFFHRYQVEAVVKALGGVNYRHALRGDGQKVTEPVAPDEQRRALAMLLRTLQPAALVVPDKILPILPPRAYGYEATREVLGGRTEPPFDAMAGPEAAANLVVKQLLDPARAARLLEHHARDDRSPGLQEVMERLLEASWKSRSESGYQGAIQRVVNDVVLYHLMALAANERAAGSARAAAHLKLEELETWLVAQSKQGPDERAQKTYSLARIRKFLKEPSQPSFAAPLEPPPGQPIGSQDCGGH